MKLFSVILAGGSGTRLWPASRASKPKQFLSFCEAGTLLQQAFNRNQSSDGKKSIIITGVDYVSLVDDQLKQVSGGTGFDVIVEPEPKNTAPAIIAAALKIYSGDPDAIIVVTPSDNEIKQDEEYKKSIEVARGLAEQGYYVTLGVEPARPEIAYGYIKRGNKIKEEAFVVERFVEKPNLDKVVEYLKSGSYYWNLGVFLLPVKKLIDDMVLLEPEMVQCVRDSLEKALVKDSITFLDKTSFSHIKPNSIDYALMEKADKVAVVPVNFSWNDMGTWKSVWETQNKDTNGNVLSANAITVNTTNSLVSSSSGRLIATVDMEDVSIIETPDALLVANNNSSHNVRHIVASLQGSKRTEVLYGNVVHKPWGTYEVIAKGDDFLVKKIIVKPGQKLSLQAHVHRSEHWVLVKGIAEVTVGNKVQTLEGQGHVFISPQEKHRLVNPGMDNLELVEIQLGDILEESDIIRFEDIYGRA